jgi:hypothetical protein
MRISNKLILKKKRYQTKCPKCGVLGCYDHCALCGIDIIWRPSSLDPELKYTGTKPLRADTEEPHNFEICRGLSFIEKHKFSYDIFLRNGYPPNLIYTWEQIEAMKDPVLLADWNRKKEEWIKKWGN